MDRPDEEEFSAFKALGKSNFRNARVAHRFDSKWDTGTWRRTGSITQVAKVWCKHDLKLEAYGMDQVWCLGAKGRLGFKCCNRLTGHPHRFRLGGRPVPVRGSTGSG